MDHLHPRAAMSDVDGRAWPPLEVVLGKALQIPAGPRLLPALLQALNDPTNGADEIARLIELDPGLATSTLRLANSSWFGGRRDCDDLREAIFRLGAREVYRLAATSMTLRWIDNGSATFGWDPDDFCRHSLCVAIASRLVSRMVSGVDEMRAYTAGLTHDMGKLAIAQSSPESIAAVRSAQAQNQGSWREAERVVLGYDHTDVGAALMERWGFPRPLIAVAQYYCQPSQGPSEHAGLLAVVHAAKHLAISLGIGVGAEGFLMELDGEFLVQANLEPTIAAEILPVLHEDIKALLGGSLFVGRVQIH